MLIFDQSRITNFIRKFFVNKQNGVSSTDWFPSYERKKQIIKTYYEERKMIMEESYYGQQERSFHNAANHGMINDGWIKLSRGLQTNEKGWYLYQCRNDNHISFEVYLLDAGDDLNSPFIGEKYHNNGDGNLVPYAYMPINEISSPDWLRVNKNVSSGMNLSSICPPPSVIAYNLEGELRFCVSDYYLKKLAKDIYLICYKPIY